jgi:hypothetical protein
MTMFASSFDRLLVRASPATFHSMRLVSTATGSSLPQQSITIRLFCFLQGDEAGQRFPINIANTETADELKKKNEHAFRGVGRPYSESLESESAMSL